jgi:hypothetical protein
MRLSRDGTGDGTVLVEDARDLDHLPERIVVHLIAAREPRPVAPGRLVIASGKAGGAVAGHRLPFGGIRRDRRGAGAPPEVTSN